MINHQSFSVITNDWNNNWRTSWVIMSSFDNWNKTFATKSSVSWIQETRSLHCPWQLVHLYFHFSKLLFILQYVSLISKMDTEDDSRYVSPNWSSDKFINNTQCSVQSEILANMKQFIILHFLKYFQGLLRIHV